MLQEGPGRDSKKDVQTTKRWKERKMYVVRIRSARVFATGKRYASMHSRNADNSQWNFDLVVWISAPRPPWDASEVSYFKDRSKNPDIKQAIHNTEFFTRLASFFACLQVFHRPLKSWVRDEKSPLYFATSHVTGTFFKNYNLVSQRIPLKTVSLLYLPSPLPIEGAHFGRPNPWSLGSRLRRGSSRLAMFMISTLLLPPRVSVIKSLGTMLSPIE